MIVTTKRRDQIITSISNVMTMGVSITHNSISRFEP